MPQKSMQRTASKIAGTLSGLTVKSNDNSKDSIPRVISVLLAVITVGGLLTTSTYPGLYGQVPTGFDNGTLIDNSFNKPYLEQWFRSLNGVSFFMSLVAITAALTVLMKLEANPRYVRLLYVGKIMYTLSVFSLIMSVFSAYIAAILSIFLYVSEKAGWVCFAFSIICGIWITITYFCFYSSDNVGSEDFSPINSDRLDKIIKEIVSNIDIQRPDSFILEIKEKLSQDDAFNANDINMIIERVKMRMEELRYT